MIRARGVGVDLGGRRVLDAVDVAVAAGELVAVLGPNGAGKSTLARVLAGVLVPGAGEVVVGEAAIGSLTPAERARRVAYLPQGGSPAWPLTVARLVGLGRLPHLAPFSRIGPGDAAAIHAAMARADVLALRDRTVTELSGGERARVLLARALAVQAPVLIADEPLAALDPGHALGVMTLLRTEAARGVAVVAVLHELTMAARFADRVVLLDCGRVVADGRPGTVLDAARLAAVYGIAAWHAVADGAPLLVPLRQVAGRATETP